MKSSQHELRFRTHGGARKGAGRKPLPKDTSAPRRRARAGSASAIGAAARAHGAGRWREQRTMTKRHGANAAVTLETSR